MISFIVQALALYAISWLFWRIIRQFVARSTLDNVAGPPSASLVKGNFSKIFDQNAWDFHKEIAQKYGGIIKIKGLFGENRLYIFDPKALHQVIVKDQYTFEETDMFIHGNRLMFGDGLLATLGEHHRKQRKMLNPVFSIVHMREMTPTFWKIAHKLRNTLEAKVKSGQRQIDATEWMTRTALELIGQSGLGYSFDPLTEDATPHPYSSSVKQLIPVSFRLIFLRNYFLPTAIKVGTPKFRRWLVNILPWKTLHHLRDIVDTMHNVSVEIFESKKRALAQGDEAAANQVAQGKDIMSILLKANMEATADDKLDESELIGQMSTLTFAAMDTTSSALSRILHLLCSHPEVQEKLREELKEARKTYGDDLEYNQLVSLPYLDAVCRETLRLYPPVSQVTRVARKETVLSLSSPVKGVDGSEITEITVPKDTNVIISILSANRNPEIWGPDSYEWKPERWLSPLPETVIDAHIPGVYSHLMTFIGGGRACIGFKFSQLEMKVVLSVLIESFKFSLSEKEIFWQMNGITTPSVVGGDASRPSLPVNISLA